MAEEKHGIIDSGSKTDVVVGSGNPSGISVLRKVCDTQLEDLPDEAVIRCVDNISRGLVLCALVFIVLSFVYPDRVSAALSHLSILAPAATLLLQHYLKVRARNGQQ